MPKYSTFPSTLIASAPNWDCRMNEGLPDELISEIFSPAFDAQEGMFWDTATNPTKGVSNCGRRRSGEKCLADVGTVASLAGVD
ncbi:hypothetical protein B0H14DRAFT_3486946 [Mycena olivaceomarginata]|nr:hypothetical protein B0H14DRAFT_3486946 [Mycena olivaceomarginata]